MAQKQLDKEVHISLEDQQKINKFARLNSRLEDLKDDLKAKQEETKTLEDASGDLMMLEDDDEKVPYQIGEVFVYLTQDEAQEKIETSKDNLGEAIKVVETRAQAIKDEIQKEVDKSVEFAEESPFPEVEEMLLDVYSKREPS